MIKDSNVKFKIKFKHKNTTKSINQKKEKNKLKRKIRSGSYFWEQKNKERKSNDQFKQEFKMPEA